jgi:hypothetical protein
MNPVVAKSPLQPTRQAQRRRRIVVDRRVGRHGRRLDQGLARRTGRLRLAPGNTANRRQRSRPHLWRVGAYGQLQSHLVRNDVALRSAMD